jgi:pimeloyl-ACP methyl ester carboxylesterase
LLSYKDKNLKKSALMVVTDAWSDNNGIRLHYLDGYWKEDHSTSPLLYVPGGLAGAESFTQNDMKAFAPRRCVSVSLRGRGRSDSPNSNYSFGDHVSDLEAIIESAKLHSFILLAYSMGVPVGLEYATKYPTRLRGVILLDYPARYPAIPVSWVERVKEHTPANVQPHVIRAIQRESREVLLWNSLEKLKCPVLIIHGGKQGALLTDEGAEHYAKHLDNCTVVKFHDSDHQLWNPDPHRFFRTIIDFLNKLESNITHG